MIGSRKLSIIKYLRSLISFRFLPINRIYWLVLLSSTPLLFGSQIGVSIAAEQKIAQVVVEANMNRPNLKVGSEGVPVRELQAALTLLGFYEGEVNGMFTETTQKAVSRFQQAAGLKADGVVDTNTWQTIFPNVTASTEIASTPTPPPDSFPVPTESFGSVSAVNNSTQEQRPITPAVDPVRIVTPNPEPKPATPPKTTPKPKPRTATTQKPKPVQKQAATTRIRQTTTSSQKTTPGIQYTAQGLPILRPGMQGSQVVELQEKLSNLGFLKSVDGDFGPVTAEAVKAFQQRNGLEPDGVVGGATWQLLDRGKR